MQVATIGLDLAKHVFQIPDASYAEGAAVLHGDGIRLLSFLPLDRFPLKKAVYRHDAATLPVRIPECRQIPYRLAFGIDRLTIVAPIRNQAPAQWIERYFTRPVITANNEQFLAWRCIPPGRIIVHTAVPHVHAIDDGISKRPAALDDPSTHKNDIVGLARRDSHRSRSAVLLSSTLIERKSVSSGGLP
jgi:hypothetical protein